MNRRNFLHTVIAALTVAVTRKWQSKDTPQDETALFETGNSAPESLYEKTDALTFEGVRKARREFEVWRWQKEVKFVNDIDPIADVQLQMANAARITFEKELGVYVE